MNLDISKIRKIGWSPRFSSREAVEISSKELVKELECVIVGS